MQLATRLALPGDRDAIWALYQTAMRPHIERIWGWDEQWQIAHFDMALSTTASYVVAADGKLAGYFQLDLNPEDIYLRMLVLTPGFQSRGIGARLLADIVHMSVQSRRGLSLRVFRVNAAARRFYEREGWTVQSEDDAFFVMAHASCKPGAPAVNFRLATVDDIPAMSAIRLAVTENVLSDPSRVTEQMYRDYLDLLGRGWVAESGGAIAGFCYADREHASIWALFMAQRHEGRGIAKRLLKLAADWLVEQGSESVQLTTTAGTRADAFYARQGWTRELLNEREVRYTRLRGQ
jgi:GNAT superfamily N-acetyltransferase